MFNVRSNQGVLATSILILITQSTVCSSTSKVVLTKIIDESHPLFEASVAIRLLLSSWARMEDQTESREERMHIQNISMNWGRQVDKVINQLRDRDE